MTSSIGNFFSGGAKAIGWADANKQPLINKTVSGTIEVVHPPEPVLDPKDGKDTGKQQIRIVLATAERDPMDPEDDGRRTLYVKSYMRGAIGDALRKAGNLKEPQVGGQLTVTLTHTLAPERPGLSPSNQFSASYVPPSAAATQQFFGGQQAPATNGGPSPQQPQYPPQPQYAPATGQYPPQGQYVPQQQPQPQYAPANATAMQPQAPGPQRPATISEAAWGAMDPPTRAAVAATMGGNQPPF